MVMRPLIESARKRAGGSHRGDVRRQPARDEGAGQVQGQADHARPGERLVGRDRHTVPRRAWRRRPCSTRSPASIRSFVLASRSEDELRALWSRPDTRAKLLGELAEKGFPQEQLRELQRIIDAEKSIEDIKVEKHRVVRSQKYEEAAKLRDRERSLIEDLESAKARWEEESKNHRITVTADHVEEVVAMMTGIPVQRIAEKESGRLARMDEELQDTVIGQNDAISKVVRAIQRNRAGLKDPNKPIGSFIFLGPTGVGKTQLAKELSRYLFHSEDALIRIDMSEYMEKFAVSRLIGAPPGYIGYEEGGQLTEKVRRHPYSIILLDEIEKAHPDVFNLLLQALDDGQLTDSLGRKIDFRNTIMIMTSNIGARQLADFGTGVGFGTKARMESESEAERAIIQNALKKTFAPEFLNRIDDVVIFNSLNREDIHQIIDIELKKLYSRIEELGYGIEITDKAKDFISNKGFDEKYGARPLKRAIQKYVEDPLAEEIINSKLEEGDTIKIDLKKDTSEISIKIKKGKKPTTEEDPSSSANGNGKPKKK